MHLTHLVLLAIGATLAQGDQFLLERYWGYVYDKVHYITPIKCLAQCSSEESCCAFAFIAGVTNVCQIFYNCDQAQNTTHIDMKRVYYKKVVNSTTPIPKATTNATTASTTVIDTTPRTPNFTTAIAGSASSVGTTESLTNVPMSRTTAPSTQKTTAALEVSEWSSWTDCAVTCGGSYQTRSRVVPASLKDKFEEEESAICNDKVCARGGSPCTKDFQQFGQICKLN